MTSGTPPGYSSVSPLLLVEDVREELEFLKTVFDSQIIGRAPGEQGEMLHGAARIGDTVIMLVKAGKENTIGHAFTYVWRDNVEATYRRALEAGAQSVSEPADQEQGAREARIRDPQGNTWLLGQLPTKMPTQDVERRLMNQRKSRM